MIPNIVWWKKGECQVEILKTGHFPTTVIAKIPSGMQIEIDLCELFMAKPTV